MEQVVTVIGSWSRGNRRPRIPPSTLDQPLTPGVRQFEHLIRLLALLREQRVLVDVYTQLPAFSRPEEAAMREMVVALDQPQRAHAVQDVGSVVHRGILRSTGF